MSECGTTFWEQGEDSLDSDLMSAAGAVCASCRPRRQHRSVESFIRKGL